MIKILRVICWILSSAFILMFMFLFIAPQFGWYINVIPTKSMVPVFNPGGMVITRPISMENIKVGDIILFHEPTMVKDALICHRVIKIHEIDEGLIFETKGDANDRPDSWKVTSKNFVGLTTIYIPLIGMISYKTQLHQIIATFFGIKITLSSLIVLLLGLILITSECKNIWQWVSNPNSMRHKERVKLRQEKILRRRRARN